MSLKNAAKMTQREKFELINSEVRSFYEYCKEAGISDEDMDIICRPLTSAVRKASIKRWTRTILCVVMVLAIGYTVSQTDSFQWHAAALARMMLIRLLPIWDWTPLYYNKCLIERSQPHNLDNDLISPTDCISCESIRKLQKLYVGIDAKTFLSSYNFNRYFYYKISRLKHLHDIKIFIRYQITGHKIVLIDL